MSQDIQFILYNLPEKEGKVQVIIRDETIWCTQKAMAQLFGVDRTVVSKHLKIYLSHLSCSRIQHVQNLHILGDIVLYRLLYDLWQKI